MTDTPESPAPAPETAPAPKKSESVLSKSNLTLALATAAFVLALAPYVLPNIQSLIVRGGIVARPEVLVDASNALREKQDAETRKAVETAVKANEGSIIAADDPIIGNPSAPITIVEFHDYLCGACRASHASLMAFVTANPDVRVVVKEYPIIGKDNSRVLAALALAARDTGHYTAVHNAIYSHEMTSQADVDAALTSAGVDPAALHAKAQTPEIQAKIDETLQLGYKLGINATPNFIVDGVLVNGGDIPRIQTLVSAARQKAK
ncbi:thioredoxin domain-containing protein [Asticcacaulis sp. AND118]|uniref:thioredoxin domain-containing protein n=1 Tax=Asticcacaulis sp. AND118 TaxID=2840468 RepID=UPI001CFF7995|nr:thioredoxin domain-containing protein [Asticcacaulis sp. AND118]UDF02233.1 thioredoxin domain-containing protein [Asticcacaulis sp. AND118]